MLSYPFRLAALSTYDTRHLNLAAVLEAIRDHPGKSRSEIGERMPFSRQTMTNVVQELLDMALVKEEGRTTARVRGNPHRGLWVRPEAGYALGVQIRWDRCMISLVDLALGVAASEETPIAVEVGDMEGYFAALEGVLRAFLATHADKDIWAIGLAGPLSIEKSETSLTTPANRFGTSWFRETMFRTRLEESLGLPVRIINNPQAAALAQSTALPAEARFVYVLLGMGLGAAFVSGRALSRDIWPQGGELSHVLYRDRPLGSILSSAALLDALGMSSSPFHPGPELDAALADSPALFEPWLSETAPILRFIVNFLEAATWPDGIFLGGFVPKPLLQMLIDRSLPLTNSVVLPEGEPRRLLPRLSVAAKSEEAIPFGAAFNVLSYRQNSELPQLLAPRRPTRRAD